MNVERYEISHGDGGRWAVPSAEVGRVTASARGFRLHVTSEVPEGGGVVHGSEAQLGHRAGTAPSGPVPGRDVGLAVVGNSPVVAVDPGAPPPCVGESDKPKKGGVP